MFRSILIANRGEIACRIIRTARAMGVRTVAVYSDADAEALHVRLADRAVRIGPAPVAQSYLRGDKIIAAALEAGAEAIHPGYGFLSENPDFVEAVTAAGLVFIGPSARAIRAMGLKDAAKRLMEKAGVPVVPGYHGDVQEGGFLEAEAARIGFPVLIKAVAGGGGKGMRRVDRAADFADALASARAEACTAFGNDAVLIEKYVESPRHIEVQVFGDGTGAVHLFERDCSLQRRHQKVIEEAPAPGMTPGMRKAMGDAAVRAATAIGYAGAGTVEFIVDGATGLRPDGFWFMEMNTRLQVEHPVTEAITGVDLVEWQLRVAAGEPIPLRQEDLRISGHAFEARLYAEDVAAGFLPVTGTLKHLVFPPDVRADSGVAAGDAISPWYDPMIAKVIVHGPDRPVALARLSRALAATQVAGTVTNLAFLRALADHAGFGAGKVDTGLIARDVEALATVPPADAKVVAQAVLALSGLWDGGDAVQGFALWKPLARRVTLLSGGEVVEALIRSRGMGDHLVEVAGEEVACLCGRHGWRIGGDPAAPMALHGEAVTIFAAASHGFTAADPLARRAVAGRGGDAALAPMPGLVRAVAVVPGAQVAAGDRLAVLEAMKMEHVLRAPRGGTVATVSVAVGDQVDAGAVMVTLEPEEAAS